MTELPNIELIGKPIIAKLKKGFPIDNEVQDFIYSTLGIQNIDEINDFFLGDDFENSGIIDLILYPNDSLRIELESLLPTSGLSAIDNEHLIKKSANAVQTIDIKIQEYNSSITITAKVYFIEKFINKLNLTKPVDPQFGKLLKQHQGNEIIITARMIVRKKSYFSTKVREKAIILLVEKMVKDNYDIETAIKYMIFILNIFIDLKEEIDLFNLIAAKKHLWNQQIKEAERFEEIREKYSMELLMMQRITPPVINIDENKKNIETADEITLLLFNKIPEP